MRARLSITITPDDVGRRVTVRARHHGPEASAFDVVGVLVAWSDGQLTITRRNGEQRKVPERDLLAGKVVPDVPPRNAR
jgi:N-acetylglutamate synthase